MRLVCVARAWALALAGQTPLLPFAVSQYVGETISCTSHSSASARAGGGVPVHLGAGGDLCSGRRAGKLLRSVSFLLPAKEPLDEHGDEHPLDDNAND